MQSNKTHAPRTRRQMDTAPQGQLLWTFFVALAVAVAALQHVFGPSSGSFYELTVAARAPGSARGTSASAAASIPSVATIPGASPSGLVQYQ